MSLAIDKTQVARQFSRAASHYRQASEVQNRMADQLVDLIPATSKTPKRIIDLGCGAGYLLERLIQEFPGAELYGLDLAAGMIEASEGYLAVGKTARSSPLFIQGDMESLPLVENSFDLVFSNAALQWTDCKKSLAEITRVLAPGGIAILATFVDGTLAEWRAALADVGLNALHQLPDAEYLSEIAASEGLDLAYNHCSTYQIDHLTARELLESTKRMGATNAHRQRSKGMLGRQTYLDLLTALETQFPELDYASTYQANYLVLRKAV